MFKYFLFPFSIYIFLYSYFFMLYICLFNSFTAEVSIIQQPVKGNQSIDWLLYDRGLRRERVKYVSFKKRMFKLLNEKNIDSRRTVIDNSRVENCEFASCHLSLFNLASLELGQFFAPIMDLFNTNDNKIHFIHQMGF